MELKHPWSYSALTSYETCPKRYQLTRVTKQVTEPQTEATRWGNEVHKALELLSEFELFVFGAYSESKLKFSALKLLGAGT